MPRPRVALLDSGSGNLRSAERALYHVGADATVTADASVAEDADALVVPGVGAFAACMRGLRRVGAPRVVGRRLAGGRPVLGICVGMQVLFERGLEHGTATEGLGEWPGTVERLDGAPVLPHMGWSTVEAPPGSALFDGVAGERFYFLHSYAVRTWAMPAADRFTAPLLTWAEHGDRFLAAVENGPLVGTQFHPEKSGDAGLTLLESWLATLP